MTNFPLLKYISKTGKPMIISTGMSKIEEIEKMVNFMKTLHTPFVLLHANSTYPSPIESLNVSLIPEYVKKFNVNVGFSDHETGIIGSLTAANMGAVIIERHITLDKKMKGLDHSSSLEPNEFKELVNMIRLSEKAKGKPIKKMTTADLMPIEAYEAQRPVIRQAIMEHKKTRRVELGPNAMLHFEDYMVMRYQILELMRVEKISGEDELLEELDAYNPLIPDGSNLKVTFMLEYPDPDERAERLSQLIGIEEMISIQIEGHDAVYPIANEDLPRSTDEKTSAVHFLRFEFTQEMIDSAKSGANWTIQSEHLNYQHSTNTLKAEISQSLLRDFT